MEKKKTPVRKKKTTKKKTVKAKKPTFSASVSADQLLSTALVPVMHDLPPQPKSASLRMFNLVIIAGFVIGASHLAYQRLQSQGGQVQTFQGRSLASVEEEQMVQPAPILEEDPISEAFRSVSSLSIPEKVVYWTQLLQTEKKALLPLPAKMDSTEFAQLVIALVRSNSSSDLKQELTRMKVARKVKHPDLEWIPHQIELGILSDETASAASQSSVEVQKERNSKGEISYLPIEVVQKNPGLVPSGTLLGLVHSRNPRFPGLILQQGFVIQDGGKTLFRRSTRSGAIETDELGSYLSKQMKLSRKRWPFIGVQLLQIQSSSLASSVLRDSR